jgi:hypothetical protein
MAADITGDADACHPADPRADLLYPGHERIRKKYCPEHRETKLSADLGVCCDTARVVVGSAGYDTRTELSDTA